MAVVVTDRCIKCKFTDCVDVCPVDCFYEGEVMVVINPDECIDCGLCVPECPTDAIVPDSYEGTGMWVEINRTYSSSWPKISKKHGAHSEAEKFRNLDGKYPTHFSEFPAAPAESNAFEGVRKKIWGRPASESNATSAEVAVKNKDKSD